MKQTKTLFFFWPGHHLAAIITKSPQFMRAGGGNMSTVNSGLGNRPEPLLTSLRAFQTWSAFMAAGKSGSPPAPRLQIRTAESEWSPIRQLHHRSKLRRWIHLFATHTV